MLATGSRECVRDAAEAVIVGRNSKPQQFDVPIECTAPDVLVREFFVQRAGLDVPDQPEQGRSAHDRNGCGTTYTAVGEGAVLDARSSSSPESRTLTYHWQLAMRPARSQLWKIWAGESAAW